jgi:tRNA(Ile)-lysidine synthase
MAASRACASVDDFTVTEYVLGARRPSPASTLLLSFARRPPECLRERVVLRVLRYVSPQPWGSPAAEAGRSSESLQRIAEAFWGKIGKDQPKTKKSSILRFTAGGHVLWSKVVILPNGRPVSRKPYTKGEDVGWLATRLPPSAQEGNSSLNVDITHRLRDAAENNQSQVQILWDCRFLIEFDVREMLGAIAPKGDMRMHIVPQERWFSPALRVFGEGIDQTKSLVGDEPIPKWARVTFIRELGSL